MARAKKNGTYLNVCIETPIYKSLEIMKVISDNSPHKAFCNCYKNADAHDCIAHTQILQQPYRVLPRCDSNAGK